MLAAQKLLFVKPEPKPALLAAIEASNQKQLETLSEEDSVGTMKVSAELQVIVSLVEKSEFEPHAVLVAEIVRRVCKMRDGSAETEKASLKQLKKNRGRISGQLSNLIRAIADGGLAASEQVRSYQEQIETELQKIDVLIQVKQGIVEERLSPISIEDSATVCEQFRRKLKSAPIQLQRRYVRTFVESIEVSLAGVTLKGSIDVLADASRSPEAANDIGAPGVQSSIRKWRCCQSDGNLSLADAAMAPGANLRLRGSASGNRTYSGIARRTVTAWRLKGTI